MTWIYIKYIEINQKRAPDRMLSFLVPFYQTTTNEQVPGASSILPLTGVPSSAGS